MTINEDAMREQESRAWHRPPTRFDPRNTSDRCVLCALALVAAIACGAGTEREGARTNASDSLTPSPAVASPSAPAPPAPEVGPDTQRVGLHVPEEFSDMGAPVMQYMAAARFRDSSAALALFHVALSRDREEVWLLEHLPRTHPEEPTGWTVLAAVTPPDTLSSGLRILLNCARRGTPNPRLIAVVHWEDMTTLTHIERAWEMDPARRIVGVPTEGITCHNEIVLD
jgi:hypothetical protein